MASAVEFPPMPLPASSAVASESLANRFPDYNYSTPWLADDFSQLPSPDPDSLSRTYSYEIGDNTSSRDHETQLSQTKRKASHAKLHKKAGSRSSQKGRRSEHSDRSVVSTPPIIDEYGVVSPPIPSSSSTRSKLRNNVLRLASRAPDDTTDVVDLDKTTAENEELSGLGISSRQTKSVWDVEFTKGRHVRNTSNGSFKPSSPFVHPINRPSNPSPEPPDTNSHTNSFTSSYSGASYALSSSRHRTASNVSSVRRPSLRVNTSGSSGRNTSLSHSTENITFLSKGSRRGTTQSLGTSTPVSRSSLDRAFSIKRNEPIDDETRAASIKAARQAFAEREEAKTRKYAEQDRKSAEKEARRIAKREHKEHRKASTSSSAKADVEPAVPRERQSSQHEESGADQRSRHVSVKPSSGKSELPSVYTRDPSQSQKKQALHVALMSKMKIFNSKR